jgi:ATP-dependent helicase Lhr and Lhr-like helicase
LLARIHRYRLKQLRNEIEPVNPADFMPFLFDWQGLVEPGQGVNALERVISAARRSQPADRQLGGGDPAGSSAPYFTSELDELCSFGKLAWLRLLPPDGKDDERRNPAIKSTSLAFIFRPHLSMWYQTELTVPEGIELRCRQGIRGAEAVGRQFL